MLNPDSVLLLQGALGLYLAAALVQLCLLGGERRALRRGALALTGLAFALQTLYLASAWAQVGYLPVTNLFSTLFFFSWAMGGTFLYFELRYRIGAAGLFVLGVTMLLLVGALRRGPMISPLIPALDTPLFTMHVAFSFMGYALFAMAFSVAVAYLLPNFLRPPSMPSRELLRRHNEEAILLGFVFFSLCMISGSIWAYVAWGYWFSWNIKGVWSFIVWLFYAGMCHAKFVRRWQGEGYALLSIAGFFVVLFTYLGIGLLLQSNHPLE
ncbi:cytochrome c biogenesis protein CcsA [Geoalkalibacter sp.]|uniref:cytochrome c biogenesis protein CcsA n=1 Tax=Geoalkalibacter sp. TaxID=3041440 RepID=UPI00272E54C2|nr:cytochrome c biogenesis protein CcsA [Geoalkalibacter sp.]